MSGKSYQLIKIGLIVMVLVLIAVTLGLGRYRLALTEVVKLITNKIGLSQYPIEDRMAETIIWSIRFPRIIGALTIGAGLAISGVTTQGVFCNPLVSPHLLGVSAGAGFGAALGILLFEDKIWVQGSAFLWGLAAVYLTTLLSKRGKKNPIYMLVLAGVIVSALFNALLTLLKYTADTETELPEIVYWLMGSLNGTSYVDLQLALPLILVGSVIIYLLRWKLNILSLKDEEAESLCRHVSLYRNIVILASTLITATAISISGIIGWIGLVVPHIGRMLAGADHRRLIPITTLIGAIYLLIIDTIARCATMAEVPLSVLTAMIGAPFFAYLLRKTGGGWA